MASKPKTGLKMLLNDLYNPKNVVNLFKGPKLPNSYKRNVIFVNNPLGN